MQSRSILFVISLLVLPQFEAFADSATQTDWSGGNGIWGPVTEWSDKFYCDFNVEWGSNPGEIALQLIVEHAIPGIIYSVISVYSEDIDGDGDMDILGTYSSNLPWIGEIIWWENSGGSGTSWKKHTVNSSFLQPESVYSEDIDGDGDMDILGAAYEDNDITWWENANGLGTSWIEHTVDGNFYGANDVYSEDIDGDGDMDVLGTAYEDNDITWWENANGLGTSWSEHTISGDFNGVCSVYSEDINGDGDMDVLGAAIWDDDITWWENANGLGTSWIEHTVDGNFDAANDVYSEDMDGDGDMDVLGAAAFANEITWWENINGLGTSWIEHTIDENFNYAQSVYSEDMDGDGDMDVLGAAYFGYDGVTWWENTDGLGTSWTEHTVGVDFGAALTVYSEDINGDGNMDVLGSAGTPEFGDISWWDLTAHLPVGSLESSILDTECSPQWASLDWSSTEPVDTDLYFQYRTSDDPGSMGTWSDPIYEPCFLSGLLDQYFQYKVSMETDDPAFTPTLNDVTLNWDPLGIGDDPHVTEYLLFGAEPNPARGVISITFGVPELSPVELSIYDLTGRLAIVPAQDEYFAGYHQVQLEELSPGIYFCRMVSGEFEATQRFVVIE